MHRQPTSLATLLLVVLLAIPGQGAAQECVDINTAPAQQLDRIIHIGPARAEQIIQLRAQRRFANVDEMVRIRGIAAARLRDIKAQGIACVRDPEADAGSRGGGRRHP